MTFFCLKAPVYKIPLFADPALLDPIEEINLVEGKIYDALSVEDCGDYTLINTYVGWFILHTSIVQSEYDLLPKEYA